MVDSVQIEQLRCPRSTILLLRAAKATVFDQTLCQNAGPPSSGTTWPIFLTLLQRRAGHTSRCQKAFRLSSTSIPLQPDTGQERVHSINGEFFQANPFKVLKKKRTSRNKIRMLRQVWTWHIGAYKQKVPGNPVLYRCPASISSFSLQFSSTFELWIPRWEP